MGQICIETVKEFDFFTSGLTPEEYLDKIILDINNRLIKISQERKGNVFGTILIALFHEDEFTITSVGDSPAYYSDGITTKQVAKNPKRYEWMIERGFITKGEYEGYISNMHPMMWSCFENFIPMVVPNNKIEKVEAKIGDIIVMCCDGVSDWVSGDEIVNEIRNSELEYALKRISEISKERALLKEEYHDDITIIAIKCE